MTNSEFIRRLQHSTPGMKPIAKQPEVWLDVLERPYSFTSPFADTPYGLLLMSCDTSLTHDERSTICDAIVRTPCEYVCCAGHDCELWHDWIDEAHVYTYEHADFKVPDDDLFMTSWHAHDSLDDIVFDLMCVFQWNGDQHIQHMLVTLIGKDRIMEAAIRTFVREWST